MEEREKRDGMGKTYDISRVRVIKSDVDNRVIGGVEGKGLDNKTRGKRRSRC